MLTQRPALLWCRRLLVLVVAVTGLAGTTALRQEPRRPAPVDAAPAQVVASDVLVPDQVVAPTVVTLRPRPVVVPRRRTPPHRATRALALVVVTTTPQQRLDAAVAAIPGYHAGDATWTLTDAYGSWGTADWYNARVYIEPAVPANRIRDVVTHEWSHLLAVKVYGGDVPTTMAALNQWFGGTDLEGSERAADCMAKVLGAHWTHYTACTDAHWQDGARRLVARQRLPQATNP